MFDSSLRTLLLTAILGLCWVVPAQAGEVIDRIVAIVNSDLILLSELDTAVELAAADRLRGLAGAARERATESLRKEALDFLVDDKLVEQAMDRADIVIEARELEGAIADVARTNRMTMEQLETQLQRQGMDMPQYREEMKKQLRRYKFMNLHIRGRVDVTEDQARSYHKQMTADVAPDPAWHLRRVLLTQEGTDAAAEVAVTARANAIIADVAAGKDFGEIAKEVSDDASTRDKGGDAGVIRAADLSPAWADALHAATVGEVVKMEAPGGVWLLQIMETANAAAKPFEEVKGEINRILYEEAMEAEMKDWAEEQRAKAHLRILI
jgi:peptidyl-prolyl cis-trans isomerase SurA